MDTLTLKSKAKINLSLDVLRKRQDGYHDVRMIMQTIELHDIVELKVISGGIEVTCSNRCVPSGSRNIAYKAAAMLSDRFGIKKGISIKIHKNIPVAAGLAGGSANAASVMKGINKIFGLGLSENDLMALGKEIGADVPFCIKGGIMLAEGIGEILTPLKPMPPVNIVLVKPPIGVSTAWVYSNLKLDRISQRPDTDSLIKAIEENNLAFLAKNMKNVLESVTIEKYNVIDEIKARLLELGAIGSMMSGSGPSVFGIFKDKPSAENAYEKIKSSEWNCYLTQTSYEER